MFFVVIAGEAFGSLVLFILGYEARPIPVGGFLLGIALSKLLPDNQQVRGLVGGFMYSLIIFLVL